MLKLSVPDRLSPRAFVISPLIVLRERIVGRLVFKSGEGRTKGKVEDKQNRGGGRGDEQINYLK